jgi:pimeloyl-ACP methyl ester carboxylesterase
MNRARVNGTELQYQIAGSGEPVLLIGTGPIADSFVPLLSEKALTSGHTLIAYRQRRRSRSDAPPVSFAEHAADAAALLAHLGIGCTHIAGHSTGAAIALQLGLDHPELVHTVALFEPPLFSVPSGPAFFEQAGPALAAYGGGDREGAMVAFLSMVCSLEWEACRQVIERSVPGAVAKALKDSDNFFESYLPALNSWQFGKTEAGSITQPVLSVLGSDTQQLFVESHDLLHTWIPQVEDCRIEGAAHLLHLQRHEPVARGVAEFFARHPMAVNQNAARSA